MRDRVLVTVRRGDAAEPEWQEVMDADSAYFQDFRNEMQAELDRGCSITITPLSELEAETLAGPRITRASWPEKPEGD